MVKIEIKPELLKALNRKVEQTEFSDLTTYVNFVLEQVVKQQEQTYSKEEEEKVKKRLKGLGYL